MEFTLIQGRFLVLLLFVKTIDMACVTGRRDIALVIDESASVMSHNYAKQLTFLQNVASTFSIGTQATRFGAVAFNTNARLAFSFDTYLTKSSLLTAIGSVAYVPGGTSIGAGIDYARQHLFTAAKGDRSGVDDYIIVITDGFSADTVTSGIAARNAGITLFAVGVDGYDLNDLIAATGDVSKVFTAPNYDSLGGIVNQLASAFPCDYFCGEQTIGNAIPSNPVTNADSNTGQAFLLADEMYTPGCCGVVRAIEFVPSVSGTLEVLVWRRTSSGGQVYSIVWKTIVVIYDSQVGVVVNVTLPIESRIAFMDGDAFGWYNSGTVIPAYAVCADVTTCPAVYQMDNLTSLEPGMTSDWGTATKISGRVYDFRIHTYNNTAPSPPKQTTALIPDHLKVGDAVMAFAPVDPDKGEIFSHDLNHTYFYYDDLTGEIKVKSSLPRSYAKYSVTILSTDSCQNTLSTTVTITTFNSPPVLQNLPAIIFITDNITAGVTIFHLDLEDKSNDSVCCHISGVNPPSSNFFLNISDNNPRVVTAYGSRFDNKLISNHYKLTLCCSDGIIATQNYLEISVKSASKKRLYTPPGWFTMAVTMSMIPISTLIMSACIIMGVTCTCDKDGHIASKPKPK
ncbi:uncharacterized protein [Argopecten irradians]|uniref:uncharacterized protein isoform X2 n=1 Tax=Argopecten irradians TaxID=31199 RepID=UPI003710FA93